MRRIFRAAILLLATLKPSSLVLAQSIPDAGLTKGNVYTNDFFKLTWEFPTDWIVDNNSNSGEDFANHALLRLRPSMQQSIEYFQLSFSDPNSQYEGTLKQQMENKGWETIPGQGFYTLGGGVPAHRYDFRSKQAPTRYLSIAVGPWHGYSLSLASVAASPERARELIKTALTIKIRPDWPLGGQAEVVPLTSPGARPTRVRISQESTRHSVRIQYSLSILRMRRKHMFKAL